MLALGPRLGGNAEEARPHRACGVGTGTEREGLGTAERKRAWAAGCPGQLFDVCVCACVPQLQPRSREALDRPLTCMIRMHIPTVPSTCLLSSNHIFTFS